MILATIIVFIITLFFMGLKSSILVSISIPFSFLLSMIILSFFDVTINVVVLFSLILSVGILIDGAIIVVEYANRRANEGISKKKFYSISKKNVYSSISIYIHNTSSFFSINLLARNCWRIYVFLLLHF